MQHGVRDTRRRDTGRQRTAISSKSWDGLRSILAPSYIYFPTVNGDYGKRVSEWHRRLEILS